MDNKIKIIIIVLGLISVVTGFIALQSTLSYNKQKQQYNEDIQSFNQEKDKLLASLTRAKSEKNNLQRKLETINKELVEISDERDEWQNKYRVIVGEKEGLIEKLAELEMEKPGKIKTEGRRVIPTGYAVSDDTYWASVLRDKARLEVETADLNQRLEDMTMKLDELARKNNDLELELDKFTQIQVDLERQLTYNEKLSQTLSEELVREKNDKKILTTQLDTIKEDYAVMKLEFKGLTDEKVMLAKQVQSLKEEKQILSRQVTEMDQALQDRMTEIIKIKENLTAIRSGVSETEPSSGSKIVELPAIVVRPGTSVAMQKAKLLSGSVLAVNKENNFVVIDLGQSSGVRTGMTFDVYRDGAKIGAVEIIQARRDISAADIKYLSRGKQIMAGDIVK